MAVAASTTIDRASRGGAAEHPADPGLQGWRKPATGAAAGPAALVTVLAVLVTALVVLVTAGPARAGDPVAPDAGGDLPAGWTDTEWGPLGPADLALLQGVRLADLWEGEGAAVMGMQKGDSARVREVGKLLNEQHAVLETKVKRAAERLGVDLPTEPNKDQQGWLGQMAAASGPQFDRIWVDLLRAAHGKVFSLIATVRANTRNDLVRDFAAAANDAVAEHMRLLESTGLVEYNTLPTPAAPAAAAAAGQQAAAGSGSGGALLSPKSSQDGGLSPAVIWIILAVAVFAGGAATYKVIQAR